MEIRNAKFHGLRGKNCVNLKTLVAWDSMTLEVLIRLCSVSKRGGSGVSQILLWLRF